MMMPGMKAAKGGQGPAASASPAPAMPSTGSYLAAAEALLGCPQVALNGGALVTLPGQGGAHPHMAVAAEGLDSPSKRRRPVAAHADAPPQKVRKQTVQVPADEDKMITDARLLTSISHILPAPLPIPDAVGVSACPKSPKHGAGHPMLRSPVMSPQLLAAATGPGLLTLPALRLTSPGLVAQAVAPLGAVPALAAAGLMGEALAPGGAALTTLPVPSGLALVDSSTTSLEVRWDAALELLGNPLAAQVFWFVQFCKSDDTDILGECDFPLAVSQAPVRGLQPGCEYKISVRLQSKALPTLVSAWASDVFSTLEVSEAPHAPPRPVVERAAATVGEVTILAAPCCRGGKYACAQSYLLQRLEGALPADGSREEDWKSVPEVTASCSHPNADEVVPSLEKKKVPLAADRTYHFRVRAINGIGHSAWSEVATTLPPPAAPEVRVEFVRSLSATVLWPQPVDSGHAISAYKVYSCRVVDSKDEDYREVTVPAVLPAPSLLCKGAGGGALSPKMGALSPKGGALSPRGALCPCESSLPTSRFATPTVFSYYARDLQPNCCYRFWVRAQSEAGLSDASAHVCVQTQPLPPPETVSLRADDAQPNSLQLSWALPNCTAMNCVTIFELSWRDVAPDEVGLAGAKGLSGGGEEALIAAHFKAQPTDPDEVERWSSKEVPYGDEISGDFASEVVGLLADTLYVVKVRGKNGGGEGPWSEPLVIRTSLPPPQQPVLFSSGETTHLTTTLSWDQALDDAFPVTAYELRFCRAAEDPGAGVERQPWEAIDMPDVTPDCRHIKVVEGLSAGVEYDFQLRAVNRFGPGEPTEPLRVTTKCDVPQPPTNVRSLERGPFSIQLGWGAPLSHNGSEISAYALEMRAQGDAAWAPVSEDISGEFVEVPCPEADTQYEFRVRARNALGWGGWGHATVTIEKLLPPEPDAQLSLRALATHSSVTLSWPHDAARVVRYGVELRGRDGVWARLGEAEASLAEQLVRLQRDRRQAALDAALGRARQRPVVGFVHEGLPCDAETVLRVTAEGVGGVAHSQTVAVRTLAAPAEMGGEERAKLQRLCEGCGCQEYCERLTRGSYDADTLSRLPPEELNKVFDRLQVRATHREALRAALASRLGAPTRPRKVAATSDSVTIAWEAPETCGYPLVEYLVQYWQAGVDDEELRETVRCGVTCCKIVNLVADADHVFRVAACCGPKGQGLWSGEAVICTAPTECPDVDLRRCMRGALNTPHYADRVAAQLFYEQWTVDVLKSMPAEDLRSVLRKMQVKEGAVHAITQAFGAKTACG